MLPLTSRAEHPRYMHALTDLRDARFSLEHRRGDPDVRAHENVAVEEIDRAIRELQVAAIEDGKSPAWHPHEDANIDRGGRLHRALDLLREARSDVAMREENREAREMQRRALAHIEIALRETERALNDVRR